MPILRRLGGNLIRRFRIPGGIEVERSQGTSEDDDGNLVEATPQNILIDHVAGHPVQGRELLRLAEGDRTREVYVFFTPCPLFTADVASGKQADVVLFQGQGDTSKRRYVVRTSENWLLQAGHYRSFAVKEEST